MRASRSSQTPFEAGKSSVKLGSDQPNPYLAGSIEYNNFELGRVFGLRAWERRGRPIPFEASV